MKALEQARALLETAQQNLENSQNELLQKSMRALAYAKIYAEDQEELFEQLSSINLSKNSRSPRKSSSETGEAKRSRSKKREKTEPDQETQTA
jgi:hypothetical protein